MISDISRQLFADLSDTLSNNINNTNGLPGQSQLKQALQSALGKLDIVSRDEFDAQSAVLLRTREKLEALEAKVAALEEVLEKPLTEISK